MQNEQAIALPSDDYQWHSSDESWVDASDGQIDSRTLLRLKTLVFPVFDGEDMWIDFLKSADRLSRLLEAAQIPEEYINYECYQYQWSDIFCENWGIGSAYWSDATPFELMIRETVKTLDSNCWLIEERCWQEKEAIYKRFEALEGYAKSNEQTQFRVRPYYPSDYHLFSTDDEWVSASPGCLREHYLDVLKKSVGESSWIGFLKRPDRLQHIIRHGEPKAEQRSILEGGVYQWEDLASPIWGLGSKVWPDPTASEIEQVKELFKTFKAWKSTEEKLTSLLGESRYLTMGEEA